MPVFRTDMHMIVEQTPIQRTTLSNSVYAVSSAIHNIFDNNNTLIV